MTQNTQYILQRVKHIEILVRKKVNSLFGGEYRATFKGQGMTFMDFREYVPGDDVRRISWIITARTGKTYIKQFEEDRELQVVIVKDISDSIKFGSQEFLKSEVATFVAAVIAMSAIRNKDQVGLALFTDRLEHWVPPARGRNQLLRMLRDLEFIKPRGRRSNLITIVQHLRRTLKKRAIIFFISDFMDMPDFTVDLRLLAQKHEVYAMVIEDAWEKQWPNLGLMEVQDLETDELYLFDPSLYDFQKTFQVNQEKHRQQLKEMFSKCQVDMAVVPTDSNWDRALLEFFHRLRGVS